MCLTAGRNKELRPVLLYLGLDNGESVEIREVS